MAKSFSCDRCGAPTVALTNRPETPTDPIPVGSKTVVVPGALPSTSGAAADLLVEFSIGLRQDLCPICAVVAVMVLIVRGYGLAIDPSVLTRLVAGIEALAAAQHPANQGAPA